MAPPKGVFPGVRNTTKRIGPHRNRLIASEVCENLNCNPLEVLARYAMGDAVGLGLCKKTALKENPEIRERLIPSELRIRAAAELAQYIAPKRKAIELSGNVNVAGGVMVVPAAVTAEQWERLAEVEPLAALPAPIKEVETIPR